MMHERPVPAREPAFSYVRVSGSVSGSHAPVPADRVHRSATLHRTNDLKDVTMKKLALALAATLAAAATPALAQDKADFSGPSATVITGYDVIDLNTPGVKNPDGVIYGIGLGYDIQTGSAVFGAEAEVAGSSARIKAGAVTVAKADRDLYIGGRIGYVAGRALLYGKAGYTNARFTSPFGTGNADGVRLGAGVEYKFSDMIFGKVEYRYSNYEADIERQQVVAGLGVRF